MLDDNVLSALFLEPRTHNSWLDRPVGDDLLRRLHDLVRMGPTSVNCCPLRIVFLRTAEAKERLRPALLAANAAKTMAAPVTAILGYDRLFHDRLIQLFPHRPEAREWFAGKPDLIEETAFRNSSLQGGYFIVVARALGLDCGPMSGFDNGMVDAEFFPDGTIRSNFLCNLGYGDASGLFPRSPRLAFEQACSLL